MPYVHGPQRSGRLIVRFVVETVDRGLDDAFGRVELASLGATFS